MYNTKVRFDGDIIITDPCYIMNKDNDDKLEGLIYWWDYYSKAYKKDDGTYYMPQHEDYPDAIEVTGAEFGRLMYTGDDEISKSMALIARLEALNNNGQEPKKWFSLTFKEEHDRYRAAENAYYSVPHDDWARCNFGEDMDVLGFTHWLTDSTIYGDWSCTVYKTGGKRRRKLGEFCADAGMVGVFLLDEVLKYNPKFDYHINRTWTTALIKDFHGEIELSCPDGEEVNVIGTGNINFKSEQTGL